MDTLTKYKLQRAGFLAGVVRVEHAHLSKSFSDHALLEIGKNVIENNKACDFSLLVPKYIAELLSQLNFTREDQKELLQETLEGDCEYPLEVIAEMTPRQKVKNWLEWNGIQGFTDDILDVVSAAYGIILEPKI